MPSKLLKFSPVLMLIAGIMMATQDVSCVLPINPNPPTPVDPVDPEPQPVTSFKVIFVKESGSTLTAEQTAIPGAQSIREYLNEKTTKEDDLPGWREYDPQQSTTNETSGMKALWAAVEPKIETVPCLVVEVNGKVTVMDYPLNTDAALSLLKKYGGD